MAARWLGTAVAMSMNLMRFISRSQLTRPTSVVYGEGAADDEDGDAMARAAAGEGEALALAQKKQRRTVAAASGWENSRGRERRRGDARTAAMSRGACATPPVPCSGRSCFRARLYSQ